MSNLLNIAANAINAIRSNSKTMNTFKNSKEVYTATLAVQVALAGLVLSAFEQEKENASNPRFTSNELNEMHRGQPGYITAIKMVRERTGLGLKEAKDLVSEGMVELGYASWDTTSTYKCIVWL